MDDSEGRGLTRSIQYRQWLRPAFIQLSGERLVWSVCPDLRELDVPEKIGRIKEPDRGAALWDWASNRMRKTNLSEILQGGQSLLDRFVRLAYAHPQQILNYAKAFGVLEICGHGLPWTHNPPFVHPSGELDHTSACVPHGEGRGPFFSEPLEVWRAFARLFRGILNVAAYLHLEKAGRLDDWKTIYDYPRDDDAQTRFIAFLEQIRNDERVAFEKLNLSVVLNRLLTLGNVQPQVVWDREDPTIQFGGPRLFGNLVIQLVLAVSRTEGLAVCTACGNSYIPPRRPASTRNNYCQVCREDGVPQRNASRRYYRTRGMKRRRGRKK